MNGRQQPIAPRQSGERAAQQGFVEGQLSQAATDYERLVRRMPDRLDLRARLGYLALLANDSDAAIKHLADTINQGLRSRKALSHLAEAYYRKGRLESAACCYQRLHREGLAGTLAAMAELDAWQLEPARAPIEIPWLCIDPLPVITAQINGCNANLVLDTGDGFSIRG
jgi:tetratricopeptide (TPR) repeat protein